jgi:hypothetical protein
LSLLQLDPTSRRSKGDLDCAAGDKKGAIAMTTHDFHEPIFVWHDRDKPERGTRRLDCVEDAIAALFRADISAYGSPNGHERSVWTAALHRLASAKADGHAASVLSAHGAMRQLVCAVGILAPGKRL